MSDIFFENLKLIFQQHTTHKQIIIMEEYTRSQLKKLKKDDLISHITELYDVKKELKKHFNLLIELIKGVNDPDQLTKLQDLGFLK